MRSLGSQFSILTIPDSIKISLVVAKFTIYQFLFRNSSELESIHSSSELLHSYYNVLI